MPDVPINDPHAACQVLFSEERCFEWSPFALMEPWVSCYDGLVNIQENQLPVENPDSKYCLLLNNL